MAPSWIQIVIVVVLVILLFGRGRISSLMGDVARGIKSFRTGLRDDEDSGSPTQLPSDDKKDKA
jgi:sec-independent protein translocase protein TatA